jgi:hypothetical protein
MTKFNGLKSNGITAGCNQASRENGLPEIVSIGIGFTISIIFTRNLLGLLKLSVMHLGELKIYLPLLRLKLKWN